MSAATTANASPKTARCASSMKRACTPEPTKPSDLGLGLVRKREATAAAAPVRAAVSTVASSTASGNAVAGSLKMYTPITEGSPWRFGLSGCELTHLTPAAAGSASASGAPSGPTSAPGPTYEGMARKSPPYASSDRYTLGGISALPKACSANASSTARTASRIESRDRTSAAERMSVVVSIVAPWRKDARI
jgi:hypothetical protein